MEKTLEQVEAMRAKATSYITFGRPQAQAGYLDGVKDALAWATGRWDDPDNDLLDEFNGEATNDQ